MMDLVSKFDDEGFSCDVMTNIGVNIAKLKNTKVYSLGLALQGLPKPVRLIYELFTPFFSYVRFFAPLRGIKYDACIVYSPSIFWFIYIKLIGQRVSGNKILILRDLFPRWLGKTGTLKTNSFGYKILNYFFIKQINTFNHILVQHKNDETILLNEYTFLAKIDILMNWYSESPTLNIPEKLIRFCSTKRYTLAVIGNFGIAQDIAHASAALKALLKNFSDLNVLFIGQEKSGRLQFLEELEFYDDRLLFEENVTHDTLINILKVVSAGFFSLDVRNSEGHIPGKVVAYLMAGKPVFGLAAHDATVKTLLENMGAGLVIASKKECEIVNGFNKFRRIQKSEDEIQIEAKQLFSSELAYRKIKEIVKDE